MPFLNDMPSTSAFSNLEKRIILFGVFLTLIAFVIVNNRILKIMTGDIGVVGEGGAIIMPSYVSELTNYCSQSIPIEDADLIDNELIIARTDPDRSFIQEWLQFPGCYFLLSRNDFESLENVSDEEFLAYYIQNNVDLSPQNVPKSLNWAKFYQLVSRFSKKNLEYLLNVQTEITVGQIVDRENADEMAFEYIRYISQEKKSDNGWSGFIEKSVRGYLNPAVFFTARKVSAYFGIDLEYYGKELEHMLSLSNKSHLSDHIQILVEVMIDNMQCKALVRLFCLEPNPNLLPLLAERAKMTTFHEFWKDSNCSDEKSVAQHVVDTWPTENIYWVVEDLGTHLSDIAIQSQRFESLLSRHWYLDQDKLVSLADRASIVGAPHAVRAVHSRLGTKPFDPKRLEHFRQAMKNI